VRFVMPLRDLACTPATMRRPHDLARSTTSCSPTPRRHYNFRLDRLSRSRRTAQCCSAARNRVSSRPICSSSRPTGQSDARRGGKLLGAGEEHLSDEGAARHAPATKGVVDLDISDDGSIVVGRSAASSS
jgi:hypothetical protein